MIVVLKLFVAVRCPFQLKSPLLPQTMFYSQHAKKVLLKALDYPNNG